MDYFLLSEDKKIRNLLDFSGYTKKMQDSDDDVVIFADIYAATKKPGYIKKRFLFDASHIFIDDIKDVLEIYAPEAAFKGIFVTDADHAYQYAYWEMNTKKLRTIQKKPAADGLISLLKEDTANEPLILLIQEKQEHIICREDAAESMLRRRQPGVKFKQVTVI